MYSADEQLVSQTLGGDRDAFGVLVHKYQEMVFAYAFQKVRNETDAQDVMQEVFLRAYRNLYALRHPHRFRSWLYTIMSNECNRWLARAAKTRQHEVVLTDASDNDLRVEPVHAVPAEGWRVDLEQAIAALSDENRVAVSMFYMGGCTLKEISEFLGVSVNTVKTKLHRARQQLGNALSERYGRLLKTHKLTGGFLMQMMEQIRHTPAPTMGFSWSGTAVGKTVFSLITALCIFIGLVGSRDDSLTAFSSLQIGAAPSNTSRTPIAVALVEPVSYSTRASIPGVPVPMAKRTLGGSRHASTERISQLTGRASTSSAGGANPANPQFAAAMTGSDSEKLAFSGRVVDTDGNPIAGFPLAVAPIYSVDGEIQPFFMFEGLNGGAQALTLKSDTDEEGRFSIAGIKPFPIQFMPQPNYMDGDTPPDDLNQDNLAASEVVSIDIGVMTFYPSRRERAPFGGITFTIEPGTHLENIEVVVRPRMRIRGRIVFADGTPLTNAEVQTSLRHQDFKGEGRGESGGATRSDGEGYIVLYVEEPAFYTVAIEFQGLSANSEQFALEAGQRRDDLVLTLDSPPISIKPTPAPVEPDRDGAWVMNPSNGHAYRSIHCESREDAQAEAMSEGAYLVSISGAAEQEWLVNVFGTAPYWIGLADSEKEGEWKWMNGDPVTYRNWAPAEPSDSDHGEGDYVFMGLTPDGKWYNVRPGNPKWKIVRMAIIEKTGTSSTPTTSR
ncbi:MAG: sigma-70 family RNA polymerase sigma factor [Candidatus Poribacteria bacterium]|nr:sigma-70 family RNA polymerase sigma factor [Candidatus Poribacteria bacterium]